MDLTRIKLMKSLSPLSDKDYTLDNICKVSRSESKSKATQRTVSNTDTVSFAEEFEVSYPLQIIKDQKNTMMCVAFAHAYNLEIQYDMAEQLSQYYIYHNRDFTNKLEPQTPGYYNSLAEKHLLKEGVVPLHYYFNEQESPQGVETLNNYKTAFAPIAAKHKIKAYFSFKNVDQLKTFMSAYNVPAIVTIAIYPSAQDVKEDGIFPKCEGSMVGYHSMCVVGYDKKYLKVINSVGEDWGSKGYGYLDYTDPLLIQEMKGVVIEGNKSIVIYEGEKTDIVYKVQMCERDNSFKFLNDLRIILNELSKKQLTQEQKTSLDTFQDFIGGFIVTIDNKLKIQIGSYNSIDNAKKLKTILNELKYTDVQIIEYTKSDNTSKIIQ